MDTGEPTCSPSKDICLVLATSTDGGRKRFTVAHQQHTACGEKKEN